MRGPGAFAGSTAAPEASELDTEELDGGTAAAVDADVEAGTSAELFGGTSPLLCRHVRALPRGHPLGEQPVAGMVGEPFGREARVQDAHADRGPLVGGERLELVQRVRRPERTAGRRAGEREPFDAIGMRHRELLRHHAAEADAEHATRLPAFVVEQRDGHRCRPLGHGRAGLVVRRAVVAAGRREQRGHAQQRGTEQTTAHHRSAHAD